ncbi:MAG: MjaI family restriction endonuclease [Firmicutes bacterium]|nr:MjaI family restriction endonuclease [Bacillota bacterium]
MAKEWVLNSAMNRFQLNFKKSVGAVSEEIRKCAPLNIDEWEKYYFENVRSKNHIEELGKKLYIKITEVISAEISDVTEHDCIQYMIDMVIRRTYEGYKTEITTIYGQLEEILKVKIQPAPDEWDRKYNVDFYIKAGNYFIGIQIKPVSNVSHIPEIFKERKIQIKSHEVFRDKFGGKVFYVFSVKVGRKKEIQNTEVIQEIRDEMNRLANID